MRILQPYYTRCVIVGRSFGRLVDCSFVCSVVLLNVCLKTMRVWQSQPVLLVIFVYIVVYSLKRFLSYYVCMLFNRFIRVFLLLFFSLIWESVFVFFSFFYTYVCFCDLFFGVRPLIGRLFVKFLYFTLYFIILCFLLYIFSLSFRFICRCSCF